MRVPPAVFSIREAALDLLPLRRLPGRIVYVEPRPEVLPHATPTDLLDSLVARVRQDSVAAGLYRLEAFYRRVVGTDSNRAAREWIRDRFEAFGYDSRKTTQVPLAVRLLPPQRSSIESNAIQDWHTD